MKFALVLALIFAAFAAAEETAETKSMWQKFVGFFSPSEVEGETPEHEELRKLDRKIRETRDDYSREHRPQRKNMLRLEIEDLNKQRDSLANVIELNAKAAKPAETKADSSAELAAKDSTKTAEPEPKKEAPPPPQIFQLNAKKAEEPPAEPAKVPAKESGCDTVWVIEKRVVHDTVYIHDTLYVVPKSMIKE